MGYGCTTCIGNSGPLEPRIEEVITSHDLVTASVLSGNRNFEARVHQSVKANFLMSPPLVVAFALAGRVGVNLDNEPLGRGTDGRVVYLRDVWPTLKEVGDLMKSALDPETYRRLYGSFKDQNPLWNEIPSSAGDVYDWDPDSTYIQEPPFFEGFRMQPGPISEIRGASALAIFGDSVTTDHISPAGAIKPTSPAGTYLQERGVPVHGFQQLRRAPRQRPGHDARHLRQRADQEPDGARRRRWRHRSPARRATRLAIYDAAMKYQQTDTPLVIIAGQEYGTGSSRDWAAKGTRLLGVRAVIARSFERIHRSNLVGMGVLPCQFREGVDAQTLGLDGTETYDLIAFAERLQPRQDARLIVHRKDGRVEEVPVVVRIDTPVEADYYRHGGILPYVLRQLLA